MASRLRRMSVRAESRPAARSSSRIGAAKPAETMPPLRPEAPAPTVLASSTTAPCPRSAKDRAVPRPARPPPTMAISVVTAPASDGRGGTGGALSW